MSRSVNATYQDPADLLWLQAAAQLGITVARSAEVYASWDGAGTLTLASEEFLDPDDCLAQMIFHELCHLLVSGEAARHQADWGLDNTSPKDLVFEYATNRLQAALAQAYGLREFLAVTTVWRRYYDALPVDPLAPGDDAAIPLAREGLQRARQAPYRAVLHAALRDTANLATALRAWAPADSLWHHVRPAHPSGFYRHHDTALRCGECAWGIPRGEGRVECRRTRPGNRPADYELGGTQLSPRAVRVAAEEQACEYFETPLTQQDCFSCGACCHRGFDVVEVAPREVFAKRHPELIQARGEDRYVVPRPEGRCIALSGNGCAETPYLCQHYEERPRSCRDFAVGGDACLIARQRCGVFKPA